MKTQSILSLGVLAVLVGGCTTVGPKSIRNARFNYNSAIIDTRNEQLLTNLVRMRYRDPPYFLEVSSVSTQYVFGGRAGVDVGSIGGNEIAGVDGNVSYEERPTISYLPLKGDDFVDRMLSPVPMEAIVVLAYSGWRIERIMRCCVKRVNGVWNAPTASGPTPEVAPNYESFMELAHLFEDLRQAEALELRFRPVEGGKPIPATTVGKDGQKYVLSLRFDPMTEKVASAQRLKELLGLQQDLDEFYLTGNPTFRGPNEIGLMPRSLMGSMTLLSQAVEPPQRDIDAGHVTVTRNRDGSEFDWSAVSDGLFRVRSSLDPPDNAFVKVKYRDAWFYIDDSDLTSKATFNLLDQLFQLQAGEAGGASPLLTLPLN